MSAARPQVMHVAKSCAYEQILLVPKSVRGHRARPPAEHSRNLPVVTRLAARPGRGHAFRNSYCARAIDDISLARLRSDGQIARESPLEEADAAL